MRTGLKTAFKAINCRLNSRKRLVFPDKPGSLIVFILRLFCLKTVLLFRNTSNSLGLLYTKPHWIAVAISSLFVGDNPGNLGTWSDTFRLSHPTACYENDVINKMMNLYGVSSDDFSGYITSGATEANLFMMWLGKTQLEKYCRSESMRVLSTSLTHYSISKAGRIVGVKQVTVPLDERTWGIEDNFLLKELERLYGEGCRGFLLPLTLGYTLTGTSDDLSTTVRAIRSFKKKNSDAHFFLWIDAALYGLILPFHSGTFHPFFFPEIQGLVTDYHKFGLIPFPGGIVIYRQRLRKLIERKVDYSTEVDSTLLSSRSGVPAIQIWALIDRLGKSGYRNLVDYQRANRQILLQWVKGTAGRVEAIADDRGLSIGLMFHDLKNNTLPEWLESKYSLVRSRASLRFADKTRKLIIYKIHLLPHVKRKVVRRFIADLEKVV